MEMRALEGGLPKFGKEQQNFILGSGVFTGKMPTFRQQKKFLQEIFFKYKLHIISVLCRAQSIPIHFSDFCRALFLFDTLSCFSSVGWRLENLVTLEGWVILPVKSH